MQAERTQSLVTKQSSVLLPFYYDFKWRFEDNLDGRIFRRLLYLYLPFLFILFFSRRSRASDGISRICVSIENLLLSAVRLNEAFVQARREMHLPFLFILFFSRIQSGWWDFTNLRFDRKFIIIGGAIERGVCTSLRDTRVTCFSWRLTYRVI